MPTFMIYTVRPGDTLGDIALRYDTTVEMLARLNGIRDINRLVVGQRLRVPRPPRPMPPTPPPMPQKRVYVVQPGDSLFTIAQANGTTVDTLVRLNGIRTPERIYPGQQLRLPDQA